MSHKEFRKGVKGGETIYITQDILIKAKDVMPLKHLNM